MAREDIGKGGGAEVGAAEFHIGGPAGTRIEDVVPGREDRARADDRAGADIFIGPAVEEELPDHVERVPLHHGKREILRVLRCFRREGEGGEKQKAEQTLHRCGREDCSAFVPAATGDSGGNGGGRRGWWRGGDGSALANPKWRLRRDSPSAGRADPPRNTLLRPTGPARASDRLRTQQAGSLRSPKRFGDAAFPETTRKSRRSRRERVPPGRGLPDPARRTRKPAAARRLPPARCAMAASRLGLDRLPSRRCGCARPRPRAR